ncbi:MAG: glutathione S-transferase [Labilithrix sp.]|nr:glutathione S-transferase [Labilithrix sp.]
MSLRLYFHPLASFCWKVLVALYENETPFEPHVVDLSDPIARAELEKIWPIRKFPVLRDDTRSATVPESTIIIEYLTQHYPGRVQLLPSDPALALETRLRDRFYDLYVHVPMGTIVGDRIRPPGKNDAHGVELARSQLATSYAMIDSEMQQKSWAVGDTFTMADCAAAPALYYADRVKPIGDEHPHTKAYLERLRERPSFMRVLKEAEPYFKNFPG